MTLGWQYVRGRGTDLKALPTKILAVIKALRSANRNVALPNIIVFLCACENEGMSVRDLAYVSGLNTAAVSRALRTLCATEGAPDAQSRVCPGEPLLYLTRHQADGRRHAVCLTEAGRQIKDQVEFIFSDRDVMIGRPSLNEELTRYP